MMMYRSEVGGSEWETQDPAEMIDQLMLPLPRPNGP
jgi:hypothetical protein